MLIIIKDLCPIKTTGNFPRRGTKLTKRAGVTIHDTDNLNKGADADNNVRNLKRADYNSTTGFHWAVDDRQAVQAIPSDEIAYHCGNQTGNYTTVGIEICVNKDGNLRDACYNAAYIAARELKSMGYSKAVWKQNIWQHNDWNRKNCPKQLRAGNPYNWATFVELVNWHLGEMTKDNTRKFKAYTLHKMDQKTAENMQAILLAKGIDTVIEEM